MIKGFHSFSRRLTRRIVFALALALIVINTSIYYLTDKAMDVMIDNTFMNLLEVESQTLRMLLRDVETASKNSVDEVQYWIESPEKIMNALGEELEINPKIKGFFAAFEPDYFPEKGRWFEPYAVWHKGKIEIKQMGSASHDYLKSEWYQNGFNAEIGYWSEPYLDKDGARELLCTYARPFFDKQGRRVGVFGADISLNWLHYKLRKLDAKININLIGLNQEQLKSEGSYCFIIGKDGAYISHPDKSRILRKNFFNEVKLTSDTLDDRLAREMVSGTEGFEEVSYNGKAAYVFYAPVKHTSWTMGFFVPEAAMRAHAYFFSMLILTVMALGLLVVYVVCRFTIHHSTKPLTFLAKSADEVAKGNFNAPLPDLHSHDEIHQLRDSFGNMQQSLALYIEKLKTTVAEKASIESELSIANGIQMSMLPSTFPERGDVSIYGSLKPAKAVGGDLFDFFIRDGNDPVPLYRRSE